MVMTSEDFGDFEKLVNSGGRTELKCRPYLQYANNILIEHTLKSAVSHIEIRAYSGDADLAVVADIVTDTGTIERVAYFWELKAPQCYLFEYDDSKRRCRPSPDLVKAENQLLHYVEEAIGSETSRVRLGVMKRNNIRPGGIIIGTQKTMLRKPSDPRDIELASAALALRLNHLYHREGIRVLLWDRILDAVRPTSPSSLGV